MKPLKKITLFKALGILYLCILFIYALIHYNSLSAEEGWGMVFIISQMVIAAVLLLIDYTFRMLFKKEFIVNILEGILCLGFIITIMFQI